MGFVHRDKLKNIRKETHLSFLSYYNVNISVGSVRGSGIR